MMKRRKAVKIKKAAKSRESAAQAQRAAKIRQKPRIWQHCNPKKGTRSSGGVGLHFIFTVQLGLIVYSSIDRVLI